MAYKIVEKKMLNPTVFLMEVEAPLVAKKAEPGQFIILRIDEFGERVPFTVADFDREKGGSAAAGPIGPVRPRGERKMLGRIRPNDLGKDLKTFSN